MEQVARADLQLPVQGRALGPASARPAEPWNLDYDRPPAVADLELLRADPTPGERHRRLVEKRLGNPPDGVVIESLRLVGLERSLPPWVLRLDTTRP
jgi:hypothetical protein